MDQLIVLALELLRGIRWHDVLDIVAVAVVLYWILLLIRGTRAVQILAGLMILGFAYLFARGTELNTFGWILENFLGSIVIIVVILFQNEIRTALALVGTNPLTGANPGEQKHLIEEVVKAAAALSNKRIGALIVVERSTGLKDYVEKGTAIDGTVGRDLLVSIFMPFSPIHDGAVIISGGKVAAARCFLPLTLNPRLEKILGTRHRAALGLTEETDAVVVVVSEETGKISTAFEGKLYSRLEVDELKRMLEKAMVGIKTPPSARGWWERLRFAFGAEKKPVS